MTESRINILIESYLKELSGIRRLSDNTLSAYQNDLSEFTTFLTEKGIIELADVTLKTMRHYLLYLNSEKELGKSSISRKLATLRGLFRFLMRNNLVENNPLAEIQNPKAKRKLPETISIDSFESIYSEVDKNEGNKEKNLLVKAIFELLYGCALRVSELCSITINDLDLQKQTLRIVGKGSKTRIVPVGDKSKKIMEEYLKQRNGKSEKPYLFLTSSQRPVTPRYVQRIVKRYLGEVSDIEKKSPHTLRHAAATHMLDKGADIMAVKEILGHENLSTTQIYTHVSVERLKKTYKTAHPKS